MTIQTSREVRTDLVRALRLDLIGPDVAHFPADAAYERERLPMRPSRWYLTGFLVPRNAPEEQRSDETSQEELDLAGDADSQGDDDATPEKAAARRVFLPSSLGMSVLVPSSVQTLGVTVRWGDYVPEAGTPSQGTITVGEGSAKHSGSHVGAAQAAAPQAEGPQGEKGEGVKLDTIWRREPREVSLTLTLPAPGSKPTRIEVLGSDGLQLYAHARMADGPGSILPPGARAVAVFLVNERTPAEKEDPDKAYAFQSGLQLTSDGGFLGRPDPRRGNADDRDDRVADLQYAEVLEFATGHNVSCDWMANGASCSTVWSTWMPSADVPFTEPAKMEGVLLGMDALATVSEQELAKGLAPLVERYGNWIGTCRKELPRDGARKRTAEELIAAAERARTRIQDGIDLLSDAQCRRAFQLANAAMADAARHREGAQRGVTPDKIEPPSWRPFQLAFFLLNLSGIAKPTHDDRELVDLLFFPTGGGKTEAYLGLAAFTLVLRRLRNPGVAGAGVSVLMRYTLRLLTLDQLARAAGLICALEQIRARERDLGEWPFEIGLWVGRAATPNRMGEKGDQDDSTARRRVQKFQQNPKNGSPIPIERCPWCGMPFTKDSFRLAPNADYPRHLNVLCANSRCEFTGNRPLPIVAVDEPLYRRLPCFVIATVDKFAGLPFEARAGTLFGLVDRHDAEGFYGAADPGIGAPLAGGRLPPMDLIIQDELHLISGPLGTIAGLYETAIDHFAKRTVDDKRVRPKVIASTATVRRAESQSRALFARRGVELFPPASPDRGDSFFARTAGTDEVAPRQYVGVAAPGRSLRVVMLRVYVAMLSAALKAYERNGGNASAAGASGNPADPYMSLLGYFNALRELGGARRIVEGEVGDRVRNYAERKRVGEADGPYANRDIVYEPLELTSRVSTSDVAAAKKRLEESWRRGQKERSVDVALATNMISVGLDISRLGLMVVLGQPKGSAEYIQSTSRVGRDPARPGLVITLLTLNKPRDRSHFERFAFYHKTFYRSVEATSVTPFAPRAVDRVLPAVVAALARHGIAALTPAKAAVEIETQSQQLGFIADVLAARVTEHDETMDQPTRDALRLKIQGLAKELLDYWSEYAHKQRDVGASLKYQQYEKVEKAKPLLRDPLDAELPALARHEKAFKAARSMRDVEPEVVLLMRGAD
jgi:hypothetical protein